MRQWMRDAMYYWKLERYELKAFIHALNYSMGSMKLSDMLGKPSVREYNTWENEGGAL